MCDLWLLLWTSLPRLMPVPAFLQSIQRSTQLMSAAFPLPAKYPPPLSPTPHTHPSAVSNSPSSMLKPNRHTHHLFASPATHVTTPLIPPYHTHYAQSPPTTTPTPYSTTITIIPATTPTPMSWSSPPPSHRALGFLFLLLLLLLLAPTHLHSLPRPRHPHPSIITCQTAHPPTNTNRKALSPDPAPSAGPASPTTSRQPPPTRPMSPPSSPRSSFPLPATLLTTTPKVVTHPTLSPVSISLSSIPIDLGSFPCRLVLPRRLSTPSTARPRTCPPSHSLPAIPNLISLVP